MRNDEAQSTPAANAGSKYDVGVLLKALDVLEALTWRGELGLTELSHTTKANKASVFRILATLEGRGFVAKDPHTRKYSAGHRLVALATSVVEGVDLVRSARPTLAELRDEFGETVNLGVLADGVVQYLDILEGSHGLRMAPRPGTRDHLHATGLGKALLSRLDPPQARGMLEATIRPRLTANTVTSVDAVMTELAATRERGFSIDDEENEIGARCVAAAILDRDGAPLAAISVSGPAARMDDAVVQRIGVRLQLATRAVAASIGQPQDDHS
jgi:IclR family acetate operon transcriptional repressor